MLQVVLEKPLEKKAGKNYGPPGTKKLVYSVFSKPPDICTKKDDASFDLLNSVFISSTT